MALEKLLRKPPCWFEQEGHSGRTEVGLRILSLSIVPVL